MVVPGGAVISGQCALLNLNGWTVDEMILKSPVGICINFPHVPTDEELERRRQTQRTQQTSSAAKEKAEKQIKDLKEVFHKAKRYAAKWQKHNNSPSLQSPDKDLMLAALVPVIIRVVTSR